MSYCRFSSANWKSDIYCYADASGGWTIHLAVYRRVGEVPDDKFEDFIDGKIDAQAYADLHKAQMEALKLLPMVPITLPYAGESFNVPSAGEAAEKLIELKELGYFVPQFAIDSLFEEAAEPTPPSPPGSHT